MPAEWEKDLEEIARRAHGDAGKDGPAWENRIRLDRRTLLRIVDVLRIQLDGEQAHAEQLHAANAKLQAERDIARAIARTLAHSYEHDSSPPQTMVETALGYPVFAGAPPKAKEGA